MSENASENARREYKLSAPELRVVSALCAERDGVVSRLASVLHLIHQQQGLEGGYALNEDATTLIPKEDSNGR